MSKVSTRPTAPSKNPPAEPTDVDRSGEILLSIKKEPRDRVTCVRVFDDYYRCNWWAPGVAPIKGESVFEGLEVSTFRVRKSEFMRARMVDGTLVVEDGSSKLATEE